eukprot:1182986-Prorocentrum_minimum.AAC.2
MQSTPQRPFQSCLIVHEPRGVAAAGGGAPRARRQEDGGHPKEGAAPPVGGRAVCGGGDGGALQLPPRAQVDLRARARAAGRVQGEEPLLLPAGGE